MSAPLVVNTKDGVCWVRRVVLSDGAALYTPDRDVRFGSLRSFPELARLGIVGYADVLPVPVGPEPRDVETELEGARLALWEAEQRIAELESERHVTNEALDDAVQELRTSYAERARRETHPGRRQAWRMLAQCEESERVANALLTPEAERSADKLTRMLAPSQALRDVPDGEHSC